MRLALQLGARTTGPEPGSSGRPVAGGFSLQPARSPVDTPDVVAHVHPRLVGGSRRLHWWRLPIAAAVAAAVSGIDIGWKSAALAAGHGAAALDAPSSILRPVATLVVGLAALTAALVLPALCVPGAFLVVAGVSSNVASLVLWRAVPNPLRVHLGGGILHFNLADICVTGGGLVFLTAALWTLWRMPDEEFARRLAR
jgi:hypothetical protein